MDIKATIEEILKKLASDPDLKKQFQENPVKAVESVIGVDLPDDVINQIIAGVKGKLSVDTISGAVDALKKLF